MFLAFSTNLEASLAPAKKLRVYARKPKLPPIVRKSHCRFCAQEKNCTDLIDLATNAETMNKLITVLTFFKIDFIDLLSSKIPNTTCQACYDNVLNTYNFFIEVKESQIILQKLYCKNEEEKDCIDKVQNSEMVIKPESVDYSDNEINVEDVKPEKDIENDIFSQTEGFESNPYDLYEACSSTGLITLTADNLEQKCTVPDEDIISSANEIESNENKKNNSESVLKSNLLSTSTHTEVTSLKNINFVNVEVNDESNTSKHFDTPETKVSGNKPTIDCGEPACVNDLEKTVEVTWNSYLWRCKHCQLKFDTMADLRSHSMQLHNHCFGYQCADCSENYNMFHLFIEHVRRHRQALRLYCPYCNEHFSSEADCIKHELAYWSNGQKICNWCGDLYPNSEALVVHKSMSQLLGLPRREKRKADRVRPSVYKHSSGGTWEDYDWGCLECALSFTSVTELRAHSQSVHDKCFAMRCADCLAVRYDYPPFVRHVVAHRPYLRKYCPYCNQHFEDANELKKHIEDHFSGPPRACYSCGQIFLNKDEEAQHISMFNPKQPKKYLTTEDLTCQVCKKVSVSIQALKLHKLIHVGTKDYICHLCAKQFTKEGLKSHMRSHNVVRKYECKLCRQSFVCASYLKIHVKSHIKPFICDHCSKRFTNKIGLKVHINSSHNNNSKVIKKFKCTFCSKRFKKTTYLKKHLNIHTGATPYQCQNCDKSFTNWGNCNKHMKRIHGTTLAKYKRTERGKIPIGEERELTKNVKEWMAEVTNTKPNKIMVNDNGIPAKCESDSRIEGSVPLR